MEMNICINAPTSTKLHLGKEKKALGGADRTLLEMCYILKEEGHEVTLYTNCSKPEMSKGKRGQLELKNQIDIYEDKKEYETYIHYRVVSPVTIKATKYVFYSQDTAETPCFKGLEKEGDVWFTQFDLIVALSHFHKDNMKTYLPIKDIPFQIMGNFSYPNFTVQKEKLYIYCSTPYRGLRLLPAIWRRILKKDPEARLEVYSSMSIYGNPMIDSMYFSSLYEQLQKLPNCKYSTSIAHKKLQDRLAKAYLLLYPNTYPETFCNVINEARANSTPFITSDLGALKETGGGAGMYVTPQASESQYIAEFMRAYDFLQDNYLDYQRDCKYFRTRREYAKDIRKVVKLPREDEYYYGRVPIEEK